MLLKEERNAVHEVGHLNRNLKKIMQKHQDAGATELTHLTQATLYVLSLPLVWVEPSAR